MSWCLDACIDILLISFIYTQSGFQFFANGCIEYTCFDVRLYGWMHGWMGRYLSQCYVALSRNARHDVWSVGTCFMWFGCIFCFCLEVPSMGMLFCCNLDSVHVLSLCLSPTRIAPATKDGSEMNFVLRCHHCKNKCAKSWRWKASKPLWKGCSVCGNLV